MILLAYFTLGALIERQLWGEKPSLFDS